MCAEGINETIDSQLQAMEQQPPEQTLTRQFTDRLRRFRQGVVEGARWLMTDETQETRCAAAEQKLGIETETQRLAECLPLLDLPFAELVALTGEKPVAHTFGIEAYTGWLEARLLAKQMQELDLGMMQRMHQELMRFDPTCHPGELRGADFLGFSSADFSPIQFDQEMIANVQAKDYLAIRWVDKEQRIGYLQYPSLYNQEFVRKSTDLMGQDRSKEYWTAKHTSEDSRQKMFVQNLFEGVVVDWYKQQRETANTEADKYALACEFYKRIVGIHPFEDGNGRFSRLMLGWCLQDLELGEGCVLDRVEVDLTLSDEEWTEEIRQGVERYNQFKSLAEGREDLTAREVLFEPHQLAFWENQYGMVPKPPDLGEYDHEKVRQWLKKFRAIEAEVSEKIRGSNLEVDSFQDENIMYGGFIGEAFRDQWGQPGRVRNDVLERHYTRKSVFRGGVMTTEPTPEILHLLATQPTTYEVSYRASTRQQFDPAELLKIPVETVRGVMGDYNRMLAHDLVIRRGEPNSTLDLRGIEEEERKLRASVFDSYDTESLSQGLREGSILAQNIDWHVQGREHDHEEHMMVSPGVSTSAEKRAAEYFLDYLRPKWGSNSDTGSNHSSLVVVARLPREGVISIPDRKHDEKEIYGSIDKQESEQLIIGGIDPISIETIYVYGNFGEVKFVLTRDDEGNTRIIDVLEKQVHEYPINSEAAVTRRAFTEDDLNQLALNLGIDLREQDEEIAGSDGKQKYTPASTIFSDDYEDDDDDWLEQQQDSFKAVAAATLLKFKDLKLFD